MVALASVTDPRLFDPRVGDDKTYITWEDRVKVDDFNSVFLAGKRGRRTQQVGRVSDISVPLPRLKTVRGAECQL